jgi:50S ribosomal subunit-associated GTPase HflX
MWSKHFSFISYRDSMAAATASAPAADVSGGYVWVSAEYLKELEALKAELPTRIAAAIKGRDAEKLARLHAKQAEDPEQHRKKMLEKYHTNKAEINARRREAYKQKKAAERAACETKSPGGSF